MPSDWCALHLIYLMVKVIIIGRHSWGKCGLPDIRTAGERGSQTRNLGSTWAGRISAKLAGTEDDTEGSGKKLIREADWTSTPPQGFAPLHRIQAEALEALVRKRQRHGLHVSVELRANCRSNRRIIAELHRFPPFRQTKGGHLGSSLLDKVNLGGIIESYFKKWRRMNARCSVPPFYLPSVEIGLRCDKF